MIMSEEAAAAAPAPEQAPANTGPSTVSTEPPVDSGTVSTEPPSQSGNWIEQIQGDDKAYAQNKGWKAPSEVVEGYRNLEKLVGSKEDMISLPGKDATPEDMGKFFSKLGRPDEAGKYELNVPDNLPADESLTEWFRQTAFEEGMSSKATESMFSKWNDRVAGILDSQQNEVDIEAEKQTQALKQEWGAEFDKNLEISKRATRAFDITEEHINGIEKVMGTAETIKLFSRIGAKLGESQFTGSGANTFSMTQGEAQQNITSLHADDTFMKSYLEGDKAKIEKMNALNQVAYPGAL